jgi:hypothetical protein
VGTLTGEIGGTEGGETFVVGVGFGGVGRVPSLTYPITETKGERGKGLEKGCQKGPDLGALKEPVSTRKGSLASTETGAIPGMVMGRKKDSNTLSTTIA